MYYSNSNYEAFAHPRVPEGVETRSAYLVGGGLASLAAAAFLVRDGGMPGERITILEASKVPGGALDGAGNAESGWMIRGGREMEEQFQCLWDLFRSIPSLTIEGASVLDEYHRLDKDDPSFAPVLVPPRAGVPAELVVKKGAVHGWPNMQEEMKLFADWFDKYLAKK